LRFLKKKYTNKKLHDYFDRVSKHVNEHIDNFLGEKAAQQNRPTMINLAGLTKKARSKDPFLIYRINVVVDNSELTRPPIVIETAPSYQNLFGTIEHIFEPGGIWKSDFTQIKGGSILQANGGYLVFNFLDALTDMRVWTGLKRVLKNNQIIIQADQLPFAVATSAIKPEAIEVDLKVLVIGDYYTYQYLYEHDDEFRKIFKIRADFDTEMPNNHTAVKNYAGFISKICRDENLLPLNRAGMAIVVEAGVNLAGRNSYISTRFSDIADIVRESHYWAQQDGGEIITEKHVEQAIKARKERLQMSEEKLQRMILDDILMIETSGKKIGQVNGIAVFDLGDYSFGKPSKITSEVGLGNSGIINVEREAELGGKIYNKGVLIISGYLNGKYAQNTPLTMNASICFEQSYSGVDGDSASAAEIFTLLSSLAKLPLRQDIAVTGSVNQKGELQPIGGVNQKVTGVYQICKARGLTGKQGVMLPHQNVPDLMLDKELIKSVKSGKFHIYAIKSVDEGIELLTGIPAGERGKKGKYPAKTVHGMVQQRLRQFSEKMKNYESGGQST
ncbi:MAG TPA: ATP-dependent protease, partial [Bacteroidetes bacterium]|nr:ATP-dependent protease [Bacteroidota bacterium]